MRGFYGKVQAQRPGIAVYGLVPPKRASSPERVAAIAARQVARLRTHRADALVVYDLQDEASRTQEPRPFPFLPTVDPATYARDGLAEMPAPRVVYRAVGADDEATLAAWLKGLESYGENRATVLVGAPSRTSKPAMPLSQAYAIARQHAPDVLVGGIAIAERHARRGDEHQRILRKTAAGCSFFITQAVYDVTAMKSLLSDYAIACEQEGVDPVPVLVTFTPCGSAKTMELMKWLGVAFPRWLDNELTHANDPLGTSLDLCERTFEDLRDFAFRKGIPLGVNVESVSIRRAEIDASHELFRLLQRMACG